MNWTLYTEHCTLNANTVHCTLHTVHCTLISLFPLNTNSQSQAQALIDQALAENPGAFAYDEVYEEMKKASQVESDSKRVKREVRHLIDIMYFFSEN